MKAIFLILSFSISSLDNSEKNGEWVTIFLPEGLELGRTLRTDLDPLYSCNSDCISFFAATYDAHFDKLGFLDRVTIDRDKQHIIPESWGIDWKASIGDVQQKFSSLTNFKVQERDMSKSPSASSLTDFYFEQNGKRYHFYFIQWKESSKNLDGLSRITIVSAK